MRFRRNCFPKCQEGEPNCSHVFRYIPPYATSCTAGYRDLNKQMIDRRAMGRARGPQVDERVKNEGEGDGLRTRST